ncbi:MAG: HPr(Ser) kinase/phosphatase [Gemmatimonadota bacterium]|nr:HPr(Ser) kinase/phosphatase [Gemmatimonadota bacterium]
MNAEITLSRLLEARGEVLAIEVVTGADALDRTVSNPDVSSPGLGLAGYTEGFPRGRIQVFGQTEMSYLATLESEVASARLADVLAHDIPALVVTRGLEVPSYFLERAGHSGVPVFRSGLVTGEFYRLIKPYLEDSLAPTTTVHGSLADVYGVGLLFVGESGIGKSETVLDLVERGHRFVADDLVFVSRRGNDVLIGRGHELQGFHMEIRGIGFIDLGSMFGTRATRQQKRVEVVVSLEAWDENADYDRTGLNRGVETILGVDLPRVTIPLNPGKNLTVISEVIAMNQLLAYAGVDPSARFQERILRATRSSQLVEDYE